MINDDDSVLFVLLMIAPVPLVGAPSSHFLLPVKPIPVLHTTKLYISILGGRGGRTLSDLLLLSIIYYS